MICITFDVLNIHCIHMCIMQSLMSQGFPYIRVGERKRVTGGDNKTTLNTGESALDRLPEKYVSHQCWPYIVSS